MPEKPTVLLTTHPDTETLAAFARGALTPSDLATVAEHVQNCDTCCAALPRVPDDSLVGLARQAGVDATLSASDAVPIIPALSATDGIPSALADHPKYRILGELGAGGMGVVYKAEHKMMGRIVALKVLAPHLTAKPAAVDRFLKEVKAAAKLHHANIVTAHDAEEAGGVHFLVMEYVEGVSLERLVARRGPLASPMACQFARQVAVGLQHAHEQGMVHRDIKPQNLMVTRKGQVKILDFGLAKFARSLESDGNPGDRKAAATAANMLMGTPDYLSPEQARSSQGLDIRSDIYSLGCTLYFLLTGQAPFAAASTVIDKLLAHTEETPAPVRTLRPDVPDGLAAIVERLMAKKPEDRYETPSEVATVLAPFCKAGESPAAGAAPVLIPVVDAVAASPPSVSPFAHIESPADTQPEREPNGATLAEVARPRKNRKKKRAANRTVWKWAAIAGIAVAALLVGVVVREVVKRSGPPREMVEKKDDTKGGTGGTIAPGVIPARNEPPKVLYVVPSHGTWWDDYQPVREVLEKGNRAKVVTAAGTAGPARSLRLGDARGPDIPIDIVLSDGLDVTPFAAVVFCGKNSLEYFRDPRNARAKEPPAALAVRTLLMRMKAANKPIGAICYGEAVLAAHGYLQGKTVAPHQATQEMLWKANSTLSAGITWGKHVEVDGKLVTATGPEAGPENAPEFAEKLLDVISGK